MKITKIKSKMFVLLFHAESVDVYILKDIAKEIWINTSSIMLEMSMLTISNADPPSLLEDSTSP
jgi:hypothetical protein